MICLLGEPEDADLLWLTGALRRRGEHAEVVLPEELMISSEITYRVDPAGVSSQVRLHDGRLLGGSSLNLVINRIRFLPAVRGAPTSADDLYLGEEWRAVLVAWLRTLHCPVLNPPRAASLSGPVLTPVMWRSIAAAHDIPCAPWRSDHDDDPGQPVDVLCVGQRCLDEQHVTTGAIRRSLAALADYVGAPLLGVTFDWADTGPLFLTATTTPDLIPAGDAIVDAVIDFAATGQVPE